MSSSNKKNKIKGIEGNYDFRFDYYQKIIKENSKSKKFTAILFPTIDTLRRASIYFKKSNEEAPIIFHGRMSKKAFQKNLELVRTKKSFVVFLTGTFLVLLPDLSKTLIIEEENSRWYKMRNRPFLNYRKIALKLSEKFMIDVYLGDLFLSTEALIEGDNYKWQEKSDIKTLIIHQKSAKSEKYEPLGSEIENNINNILEKGEKVFVLALRKGYAPIVLCEHCGQIVKCKNCDAPVVLHKGNPDPYFLCHHCGAKRSAMEKCQNCDSWKLGSYGIGIERIEEEIQTKWPKEYDDGLIEVGTEKTVSEISDPNDLTIIPSLDSLLALPDFNIDERLFRMILNLKEKTKKLMIIKSRYKDLNILQYIRNNDLEGFHNEIGEKRKTFGYSPFKVLIKITLRGPKIKVGREMENLKSFLKKWKPNIFPAFIKSVRNQFVMHMLIRVDTESWPDEELLNYLRDLPPYVEVNVDPESLL